MTAFSVKFYGGPLAGQIHMIDNPPRRYRVPSYTRLRMTEDLPASLAAPIEVEEYDLGPAHGNDHTYTYTWINPAEELRRALKDMREVKERYRQQTIELKAEVESLKTKADKWDALVSATGKLLDEA